MARVALVALFGLSALLLGAITPANGKGQDVNHCGAASYLNSRGRCVERPRYSPVTPVGASAKCKDGTYSFSRSRRGTCSYHGGVASWL